MKVDPNDRLGGLRNRQTPALRRWLAGLRRGVAWLGLSLLAAIVLTTTAAHAKGGVGGITVGPATPPGGPTPFDITGPIQSLSAFDKANPYSGGTMVVNNTAILIPAHLVVTLPAAYATVGQLFVDSPVPGISGLALNDSPPPIASYQATISGNIVNGVYIAGLVSIAQPLLNLSNGYIRSIDYGTGELCVGASPGACAPGDARVVINDPSGRFGLRNGEAGKAVLDRRFAVDSDNPTVHAASGYPMCVPRFDPATGVDPKCPITNRLAIVKGKTTTYPTLFVMDSKALNPPPGFAAVGTIPACGPLCKDTEQAPLVPGDYITFSGILARDSRGLFVAAYAVEANLGIYSRQGGTTYLVLADVLTSTGPGICPLNAECQARLRATVFATDPYFLPTLYAVDEGLNGARTSRPLNATLKNTAVMGRYVFDTGSDINNLGGAQGVTREIMAGPTGLAAGTPVQFGPAPNTRLATLANGLVPQQYVSPVGEYIFPEPNAAGAVLTPYNFRCLAFLVNGWGQGGALINIGQLVPFPEATAPTAVNCAF